MAYESLTLPRFSAPSDPAPRRDTDCMSASGLRDERKAQDILFPAIEALRAAAAEALKLTDLQADQIREMLDYLSDSEPSRRIWDEQIAEVA